MGIIMYAKVSASNELRDPPKMTFTARAISADARELVKQLHGRVLTQYAAMPKRSYNRKAARGKLPRLIGAMVGELLHIRATNQTLGWMSLNLRDNYYLISTFGYGPQSFANLLDALQGESLIECLRGYYPALGLLMPRPSRNARIRASAKLIALCSEYLITLDNISAHFKIRGTKKPQTMPEL
jgi:hypothetical protein